MIGAFRHLVQLEAETRTEDGYGGAGSTWAPVASLWASIEAVAGAERSQAGALQASVRHRIAIRHRAGVGPGRRFRLGQRRFDIVSARDPDGRGRLLVCECLEREIV